MVICSTFWWTCSGIRASLSASTFCFYFNYWALYFPSCTSRQKSKGNSLLTLSVRKNNQKKEEKDKKKMTMSLFQLTLFKISLFTAARTFSFCKSSSKESSPLKTSCFPLRSSLEFARSCLTPGSSTIAHSFGLVNSQTYHSHLCLGFNLLFFWKFVYAAKS